MYLTYLLDWLTSYSLFIAKRYFESHRKHRESIFSSDFGFIAIGIFLVFCVVLLISTYVGLFMFKSWSPRLSIYTTILAIPLAIVSGPTAMSGLSSLLSELSCYLWGSIIALTFFSPISNEFKAKSS